MTREYSAESPRHAARLVALGRATLEELGYQAPERHLMLVVNEAPEGSGRPVRGNSTILVGRRPFSVEEVETIRRVTRRLGFEVAWAPGMDPADRRWGSLFRTLATGEGLRKLQSEWDYRLDAPTLDSPFFFNMVRLDKLLDRAYWQENRKDANLRAVSNLVVLQVLVGCLAVGCLVLPVVRGRRRMATRGHRGWLLFCSSIGLGFMLVEVSQIQRLTVFLGHPTFGLAVVLFSLLLGSGVGSWWTGRLDPRRVRLSGTVLLMLLCATVAAVGFLTPALIGRFEAAPIGLRIVLSGGMMLLLGFFMGMPFPLGMTATVRRSGMEALTPWFWAMNGAMSVTASVLAVLVSLGWGISAAYWLGFWAYGAAWMAFLIAAGELRASAGDGVRVSRLQKRGTDVAVKGNGAMKPPSHDGRVCEAPKTSRSHMTQPNRPVLCVTRPALVLAAALLLTTAGCRVGDDPPSESEPPETRTEAVPSPGELRASVPIEGYDEYDREEIEAGRRDASWRSAADSDRLGRTNGPWLTDPVATTADGTRNGEEEATEATDATEDSAGGEGDAEPADMARDRPETNDDMAPIVRMRNTDAPPSPDPASAAEKTAASETWNDITPQAFQSFAPRFPVSTEDGGPTVLAVQQLLSRVGFFPGVVDGRWGKNTEKALYWLQDELGLEPTGRIDAALYERLRATASSESPVTSYRVSAEDVAGPFPSIPEDVQEQAALDCLCYTSPAEALAERFRTTPDLLAGLNPDADLREIAAGTEILVPDVEPLTAPIEASEAEASREGRRKSSDIATIVVSKEGFYLHALDDGGRILYHFPATVGAGYDASPTEDLKVTGIAFQPTFHYQPKLFADVSDDDATAMLPAGPNSPVGVVWMQLSKEHYGIHGTAEPATIGYSTSHGCIRLTNWDAQFLAERLPEGVPVMFRGDHPDDAGGPADAGEGG